MIGSGGAADVAPVVSGPFCASLTWRPSRPFGAGFGTGTLCAEAIAVAPIRDTATNKATAAWVTRSPDDSAIRDFRLIFNAQSCLAAPLLSRFRRKEVSFFREILLRFRRSTGPDRLLQKPPSSSSTRISRLP